MAAVVGPVRLNFEGFILRDAARLRQVLIRDAAGSRGRGRHRYICQIEGVEFYVFVFFLTPIDGVADECQFVPIGRSDQVIHTQRRGCDGAGAGSEVGLFIGISFLLFYSRRGRRVANEGGRKIKSEDGVAALRGTILHNIFPLFLVIVFLRLAPRVARGEVNGLRIRRPGEGVDFFFSLRHGERFATVG